MYIRLARKLCQRSRRPMTTADTAYTVGWKSFAGDDGDVAAVHHLRSERSCVRMDQRERPRGPECWRHHTEFCLGRGVTLHALQTDLGLQGHLWECCCPCGFVRSIHYPCYAPPELEPIQGGEPSPVCHYPCIEEFYADRLAELDDTRWHWDALP